MKQAVEEVVGTVHLECVSERPSSGGKYLSVRIGPVWVENADQVGECSSVGGQHAANRFSAASMNYRHQGAPCVCTVPEHGVMAACLFLSVRPASQLLQAVWAGNSHLHSEWWHVVLACVHAMKRDCLSQLSFAKITVTDKACLRPSCQQVELGACA